MRPGPSDRPHLTWPGPFDRLHPRLVPLIAHSPHISPYIADSHLHTYPPFFSFLLISTILLNPTPKHTCDIFTLAHDGAYAPNPI